MTFCVSVERLFENDAERLEDIVPIGSYLPETTDFACRRRYAGWHAS
jgi:hypothetical protein